MKRILKMNTKPILINIIGNICSGKSTLMDKLVDVFPEAHFLKIDEYREKYQAHDPFSDNNAWEHLIEDAITKNFVFVESTSSSVNYKLLQEKFPGKILTILLSANISICLYRYSKRKNLLQISKKFGIEPSMKYIQNSIFILSQKSDNLVILNSNDGISNIDFDYVLANILEIKRGFDISISRPYNPYM